MTASTPWMIDIVCDLAPTRHQAEFHSEERAFETFALLSGAKADERHEFTDDRNIRFALVPTRFTLLLISPTRYAELEHRQQQARMEAPVVLPGARSTH